MIIFNFKIEKNIFHFLLNIEAIGMPSMRPLDEKKFTEELDIDKDGKLNKVSKIS